MDLYSLPTGSSFSKSGTSQQSSSPGKVLNTPQPLQPGRKSSHEEPESPGSETLSSTTEKRRMQKTMENETLSSSFEKALEQRKSASIAKLLPASYRNDPMRITSTHKREYAESKLSNRDYGKITSKTARLGNIDLEAFLKDDRVWNKLRPDQQHRLVERSGLKFVTNIAQLPNGSWPNIWTLAQENEYIALDEAVEKFQRNLRNGRLDPEWRANAKSAAVKRARGDFMRQETPADENEDEDESSDEESSDESEDIERLDGFEDDLDVEMVDAIANDNEYPRTIPRKLSIKIYED